MRNLPQLNQYLTRWNMMRHCRNYPGRIETDTNLGAGQVLDECIHSDEDDNTWRTIDEQAFAEGDNYGWTNYNERMDAATARGLHGRMAIPRDTYRLYLRLKRRKERDEEYWAAEEEKDKPVQRKRIPQRKGEPNRWHTQARE